MKSAEEALAERQAQLQNAYGFSEPEPEQTRRELLLTIQKAKRQLAALDRRRAAVKAQRKVTP